MSGPRNCVGSSAFLLAIVLAAQPASGGDVAVFNVKDYGATGVKSDDARPAIQKAIDACAKAGGGMVYLPPGDYTSGTLYMRSHVRLHLEAGATIFASARDEDYDQVTELSSALFFGEDLVNISFEGRGTVDGEIEHEHRPDNIQDWLIKENKDLMLSLGKSIMRSFPKGYPDRRKIFPRTMLLRRCKDVSITGLTFRRSPTWTITWYACERVVVDGIYIYSDQADGVWQDGIDPDGCKDVVIKNSVIETGDDALVFWSSDLWGPRRACENITVTNCRLSSASSALKFCDVNFAGIKNVLVSNVIITNSNRGIAFMNFDGGYVRDVVISNVTIDTRRFEWFWWGDGDPLHFNVIRRHQIMEKDPEPDDPPAGVIRDVKLQNIIARGKGMSLVRGHPESWLDGVEMENVKLYLSSDPKADYNKGTGAMKVRWAKNMKMRNVEIIWEDPIPENWRHAIDFQDVRGIELDGISARPSRAGSDDAALVFEQAQNVTVRNSRPQAGTGVFLNFNGDLTRRVLLRDNDFRRAKTAFRTDKTVRAAEIKTLNNIPAPK